MGRRVSPVFAALIILIALVIGALWFMAQKRASDAEWLRESELLRAQARAAQGRRGGMSRGSRRGARSPGAAGQEAGGRVPGRAGPGTTGSSATKQPTTAPKPAAKPSR